MLKTQKNDKMVSDKVVPALWGHRTGCAAETIYLEKHAQGERGINVGAGSDLQKATGLAYEYVCRYGLGERIMVVPEEYASKKEGYPYPEAAVLPESEKKEIWTSVGKLLDREWEQTRQSLTEWWDEVEVLAQSLIHVEKLDGEVAERVIKSKTALSAADAAAEKWAKKEKKVIKSKTALSAADGDGLPDADSK